MKLKHIVDFAQCVDPVAGETEIVGLSSDSRTVKPHYLFVALKGIKTDGHAFISEAVSRGAVAVIAAQDSVIDNVDIPVIWVDDLHRALALAAARFYEKQPEIMVAVTGTSGKTSVASFTRQIWMDAGFAAANIGTTGVFSPTRSQYGTLTTPDPVELHRLLCELTSEGVTHTIMEASSHGLNQRRLDGVELTAGAFTNLGRDHMDYHSTVEDYRAAKMRLFDTLLPPNAPAIIFADDEYSPIVVAAAKAAGNEVLTVGRKGTFIILKRVEHERFRQYIEITIGNEIYEMTLPLAGDFQVSNALVAAGIAIVTGVPPSAVVRSLGRLKGAAGRLDLVGATEEGALAYVDYSHKPDALEKVLNSVRPFTTARIILVFGCGGDRDKGKRPMMGEIATRLADIVIVTDDNPRSEMPATIRAEILTGAGSGAIEIGNRREAINQAVRMMKAGDTLIVAGKGHEEGQMIGDVTYPFSDHAEIARALKERLQ